jgi:hypothetical protein
MGRLLATFLLLVLFGAIPVLASPARNPYGIPNNALILETWNLPASAHADRALVLWMLNAEKHLRDSGEIYTCPDQTRGDYYSGLLRISLVNPKTNQLINTLAVDGPPSSDEKTIDIPCRIKDKLYYRVPGVSGEKEGKPKIINLVDLNGDGKALEFVLYNAIACMGLDTALIGYSTRQDKVIQYPVELRIQKAKGKPDAETLKWADYLFAEKPIRPGYFKYEIDYRGRGGTLDKYEVKYDPAQELFSGTRQSLADQ